MKNNFTIVSFLYVFLMAHTAIAQPKLTKAERPDWVNTSIKGRGQINKRTVSKGYFIDLYDYQIQAEQKAYYSHIIREIVSEAGIQNASEIWISFNPAYEKLRLHQVTVWRNGKPIDRLDLNKFKVVADEDETDDFLYNGSYSAYLILDDVRVGDRIEYAFTHTGENPVFEGRFFADLYLQSSVPVSRLYTSLLISPKRHLTIRAVNTTENPMRSSIGGLDRYVWEDKQVTAAESEPYEPDWYNSYRYVQLTEYQSWEEVGQWAARINPIEKDLTGELAAQVSAFKKAAKGNELAFIDKAIRFVQDEIRYTGIEMGEYSHRANNPNNVYRHRYGDCKDKSLLLASILREEHIDASLALISTRLEDKVTYHVPSPAVFNHAVVYFTINDKPYWVDPTVSYQGGTFKTRYFPTGGKALVVDAVKPEFKSVGFFEGGHTVCEEVYRLDSVNAILDVTTSYTGWQADKIRSNLAYGSLSETEKGYLDYYIKMYPEASSIDSLKVEDDREANQLIIHERYKVPQFLTVDSASGRYEASFYANMISDQFPDVSSRRKSPIAVGYPSDIDYTIRVIAATNWGIAHNNYFINRSSYLFGNSADSKGDTLILNYQFKYFSTEVSPKDILQFTSDVKTIKDSKLGYSFSLPVLPGKEYSHTMMPNNVSWLAVLYGIWVFVVFCVLAWLYYRHKSGSVEDYPEPGTYQSIGGWLVLPLIGFLVSPFSIALGILQNKYYLKSTWAVFDGGQNEALFRGVLFFEFTANLFAMVLAIFCLLLMIKQKGLFPRLAVFYYAFMVILLTVDFIFVIHFQSITEAIRSASSGFVKSIVAAAIWIPYMRYSVRVKETFVKP